MRKKLHRRVLRRPDRARPVLRMLAIFTGAPGAGDSGNRAAHFAGVEHQQNRGQSGHRRSQTQQRTASQPRHRTALPRTALGPENPHGRRRDVPDAAQPRHLHHPHLAGHACGAPRAGARKERPGHLAQGPRARHRPGGGVQRAQVHLHRAHLRQGHHRRRQTPRHHARHGGKPSVPASKGRQTLGVRDRQSALRRLLDEEHATPHPLHRRGPPPCARGEGVAGKAVGPSRARALDWGPLQPFGRWRMPNPPVRRHRRTPQAVRSHGPHPDPVRGPKRGPGGGA